jgi:L-aspartate oxidase
VTELIPVAPACHYASGGVRTDLWGRTDVPGLYATGEVACCSPPGGFRLASNPVVAGPYFARRIATVLPGELRPWSDPAHDSRPDGLVPGSIRRELQDVMTSRVGVLRHAEGLVDATALLDKLASAPADLVDLDAWETTNLLTLSSALADAAALREETRGSHWREDFPERDDDRWSGHLDVVMRDGATTCTFTPAPPTDGRTA